MKQKSDWGKLTLLRKTSCKKEIKKYWPLINGYTEVSPVSTNASVKSHLAPNHDLRLTIHANSVIEVR